jgi:NAD(P)-dependent dehydrogenase (short-subunit alcohol dehydrogenase family)
MDKVDTQPLNTADLMFRPGLMADQRVLVTGGGTGLGKVMAEGCAALGARVYICGRREGVLQETAAALNARHGAGRVVAIGCDIRAEESIASMLDRIWADGGALTGLVNNAAANFISRTEDISARGFDAIANTVFRGSFLLTRDCGRRWLAAGQRGAVVSILTTWVHNGGPFATPAAMSKAGLHAMTQSLAVEWGGRGIRCNAICPGAFPTEGMAARLQTDGQPGANDARNPTGRTGRPAELANLLIFLLSPGADFINGQTIAIDGAGFQANGATFAELAGWTDDEWQAARTRIDSATAKDKAQRTVPGSA